MIKNLLLFFILCISTLKTNTYAVEQLNIDGEIVEKYLWQDLTTLLAVYDKDDNLVQRFEYAEDRVPTSVTFYHDRNTPTNDKKDGLWTYKYGGSHTETYIFVDGLLNGKYTYESY
jgi:hypothetical protein